MGIGIKRTRCSSSHIIPNTFLLPFALQRTILYEGRCWRLQQWLVYTDKIPQSGVSRFSIS